VGLNLKHMPPLRHGLLGSIDNSFPRTSILSDPILTHIILSVLKALNFMLWILLCRKHLNNVTRRLALFAALFFSIEVCGKSDTFAAMSESSAFTALYS